MLRKIISISGKPGLYSLVNQGKNMLIVESLNDGKRLPVHSRDKVISLGDVSMYTDDGEDTPLAGIYENMKEKTGGKVVDIKALEAGKKLHDFFAEVLPSYDRDRVKTSDIKKAIQWYNILIGAGITEFVAPEDVESEAAIEAEKTETAE